MSRFSQHHLNSRMRSLALLGTGAGEITKVCPETRGRNGLKQPPLATPSEATSTNAAMERHGRRIRSSSTQGDGGDGASGRRSGVETHPGEAPLVALWRVGANGGVIAILPARDDPL